MTFGLLLAAGLLVLALGFVHSLLGELLFLRHMQSFQGFPSLPGCEGFWQGTLRVTWHVPSILALALAAMLIDFALLPGLGGGERFVVKVIALAQWLCAALTLAGTKGRHPAWAAFAMGGVLCWLATA